MTPVRNLTGAPALAIDIAGLTKRYAARGNVPEKLALDHIDLAIPRGTIFGLLGPNGAGKSTTINILAGLVNKTAGRVAIWGHDIDREMKPARSAIGIVPQELSLDPFFTPAEALELQAGLYGVPKAQRRTAEILEAVGLSEQAGAYARTLSGGMRRRLLVAKALVHNPPVLVLDEPTAGVDIELRHHLWNYVRQLNAAGTTIVLTTHYLEEAQELCERIAIIHRGRIVACDTTRALLARRDTKQLLVQPESPLSAIPAPLAALGAHLTEEGAIALTYQPATTKLEAILAQIRESGLVIADLSTVEPDLEDIFIELTRSTAPAPARG